MEGFVKLFQWITAQIERGMEDAEWDASLRLFLEKEMDRWGFIGETVNGNFYLKPAKKVTGNVVEVL